MKQILVFIIFIIFSSELFAVDDQKHVFKFGLVSKSKLLSTFKDARDSLSTWIEEIGNKHSVILDVKFFPDTEVIYDKFKKNEIDMAVLPLPFYFKNKDELDLIGKNFWTLTFSENKYTQYYFISAKSNGYNNFSDIKNKVIAIKEYDEVSEIWLDKNSLMENKKTYSKLIKDLIGEEKESTIVLDVFFKKADFGIVTKKTWDVMVELNPAIGKSIEILKKSKQIHFPLIGLFHKDSEIEKVNIFFKLTTNMKKLYNSEEMLDLLKFDSIFGLDKKMLNPLEIYYKEYFNLKKKYE